MIGITACFTGHLGQDPEMRYTQKGQPFLNFSVLPDRGYRDNEPDEWVRVTIFGDRPELVEQLKKGSEVYCEGRLRVGRWEGADGTPKTGLNLTAWRVEVLAQIREGRPPSASKPSATLPAPDSGMDELPF